MVKELAAAKTSVLVQAYSFTSSPSPAENWMNQKGLLRNMRSRSPSR